MQISLVLHNIRSAHNVGSLFRTADTAGVSRMYLIGQTPAPLDHFKRPRKDIAKVALGAEKSIAWTHEDDIEKVLKQLKKEGWYLIAIEQADNSIDYKNVDVADKTKVAFLLGNEVGGIEPSVLEQCDAVAEIHLHGSKESLNVSVAAGVALFRILGL